MSSVGVGALRDGSIVFQTVVFVLLRLPPDRHREPHSRVDDRVTHRGGQTYLSLAVCKPKAVKCRMAGTRDTKRP
jgi:hypothetical protein